MPSFKILSTKGSMPCTYHWLDDWGFHMIRKYWPITSTDIDVATKFIVYWDCDEVRKSCYDIGTARVMLDSLRDLFKPVLPEHPNKQMKLTRKNGFLKDLNGCFAEPTHNNALEKVPLFHKRRWKRNTNPYHCVVAVWITIEWQYLQSNALFYQYPLSPNNMHEKWLLKMLARGKLVRGVALLQSRPYLINANIII